MPYDQHAPHPTGLQAAVSTVAAPSAPAAASLPCRLPWAAWSGRSCRPAQSPAAGRDRNHMNGDAADGHSHLPQKKKSISRLCVSHQELDDGQVHAPAISKITLIQIAFDKKLRTSTAHQELDDGQVHSLAEAQAALVRACGGSGQEGECHSGKRSAATSTSPTCGIACGSRLRIWLHVHHCCAPIAEENWTRKPRLICAEGGVRQAGGDMTDGR